MLFKGKWRGDSNEQWRVYKGILPMVGMAHGNSGMLMPILKLWKITQKEKYEQLAEKVWTYENYLYDSETQNWKDMRAKEEEIVGIGAMDWCHGASEILGEHTLVCKSDWNYDIKLLHQEKLNPGLCFRDGVYKKVWVFIIHGKRKHLKDNALC